MPDSLLVAVLATPISIKPVAFTVDWGGSRGQGKRVGKMILGAMSARIYGKKSYVDAFGSLPDIADVRDEVDSLVGREIVVYLQARSANLDHETAMRLVLEDSGDLPPGASADYLSSKGA